MGLLDSIDDAFERILVLHYSVPVLALLISLCISFAAVFVDLDHIPAYLFEVQIPAWADIMGYGSGRPFHSLLGVGSGIAIAFGGGLLLIVVLMLYSLKRV